MIASMPRTPIYTPVSAPLLGYTKLDQLTKTALGVANVQRILLGTELAAEVALGREVERRGDAVVRLLEGLHPEAAHIVHTLQPVRGPRTKRRGLHLFTPN